MKFSVTLTAATKEELKATAAEFFGLTAGKATAAAPKKSAKQEAPADEEPSAEDLMGDDTPEEKEPATKDDVTAAATRYMAKFKPAGLAELLKKFKVKKVGEIPAAKYQEFVDLVNEKAPE